MALPLPYKDSKDNKNNELPKTISKGNAGLYFERFFNQFSPNFESVEDGVKSEWLTKFSGMRGDDDALQKHAHQQMDLIKQLNGKYTFFNTQWHFVTGTGYPHPVENGLNWHPVYGVPYITGVAVKGLVRAWVEQWFYDENNKDEKNKKRERLLKWFGSNDKDPTSKNYESTTGALIFFDALPVKHVNMKVDIMTPHQGQWYSDGHKIESTKTDADKIPADWHNPIPIPFLVVDKNSSYLFTVAPRNSLVAKDIDMDEVSKCLLNALEWLGAGAKTAGGYGQFIKKDHHPVKKSWEEKNQSLVEKFETMAEKELYENFSKNYSKNKKNYTEAQWKEIIETICITHESMIMQWGNTNDKKSNKYKAFKKISNDENTLL